MREVLLPFGPQFYGVIPPFVLDFVTIVLFLCIVVFSFEF